MHWPQATKLKARDLFVQLRNHKAVSNEISVPPETISRWCRDLAVVDHDTKVNNIEQLRQGVRDDKNFDIKQWAQDNNTTVKTARKYVRDIVRPVTYTPFTQKALNNPDRLKVRAMYQGGKSYTQIFKETGISKSSISVWCRDLVADVKRTRALSHEEEQALRLRVRNLYLENKTVKQVAEELKIGIRRIREFCRDLIDQRADSGNRLVTPRDKQRLYHQILNDEQVLELRRTVRETQIKQWELWAKKFSVSISVISMAARGITFKHLNHIETPIETDSAGKRRPTKAWLKPKLDEELVNEAIALFQNDPEKWDCTALAEWMTEKTGLAYKGNHITLLFSNRDPLMVLPQKRKYIPKNKPPSRKLPLEELERRAAVRYAARESLRQFKEEANKHEREQKRLAKLSAKNKGV